MINRIFGPPITIGAPGYDPDAQAFFTAAGITDTTEKTAVNQLVLDLKAGSIWTKMQALYPFVGSTSSTCSYNLANTATFQIYWGTATGLTFNGNGVSSSSSGYGDTGFNISTDANSNSFAYGFYSRTQLVSYSVAMGSNTGGTGSANIYPSYQGDGNAYFRIWDGTGSVAASNSTTTRLYVASRTASNALAGYRDGSSLATGSGAPGTPINSTMVVLAGNGAVWNGNFAFAFMATGLTSGEVTTLTNAVTTFATTLGRNV